MLVKRFRVPADRQELILDTLQETGWPPCIDDPLPWKPNGDAKARLRATIRHLNACQINKVFQFHANGTGTGIRWEFIE